MVASGAVGPPAKSRWPKAVLLVGLVAAVAYAVQWKDAYSPERDRLRRSLASANSDVGRVQATMERWPQFVEEYLKRERELAEVERQLPRVSRIVSFAGRIEGFAREAGVQLRVRPEPGWEETSAFYWRHRFPLTLSGTEGAIAALRQRVEEEWPLVEWVDEGQTPEGVDVSLILWSRGQSCWGYENPCRMRDGPWLLWPYSRWVSDLREELQATCINVEHFRIVLEQVSYYSGMAAEIETSRAIIAQLEQDALRGKSPERSENQD